LKKQRGSIYDTDEDTMKKFVDNADFPTPIGDVLGRTKADKNIPEASTPKTETEMDEEL
jgi:hypothetical protein